MELDELKLRKQVITERFYSVANKIKYKSIFHLREEGKDAQWARRGVGGGWRWQHIF